MEREVSVNIFVPDCSTQVKLPFVDGGIQAGFPSPAQDHLYDLIDLNSELIDHPAYTFYGRVTGESMIDAGINPGDIIVIDRSVEPVDGDIAVCCLDNEFTLKKIQINDKGIWLIPANKEFKVIPVTPDRRFEIWGIVTNIIKRNIRRHKLGY